MRSLAGIVLALSLFGLMFGAGPELVLWFTSRSWQPAEATILKVTGAARSDNGVTQVHYRYEARGGLHEGERVFLSQRWIPGGEVLAALEKRFVAALQQGRPMRLWVSPQNPDDAVFVRELNWQGMAPLLGGAGLGFVVGLAGLFWPSRDKVVNIEADNVIPKVPGVGENAGAHQTVTSDRKQKTPNTEAVHPASSSTSQPFTLSIIKAEGALCADFIAKGGAVEGVESATLDRVDGQGIMRWQDALPLNVLSSKGKCHVRCALPKKGMAVTQAQSHVDDSWQVTFKVRSTQGVVRVSHALPDQWWSG